MLGALRSDFRLPPRTGLNESTEGAVLPRSRCLERRAERPLLRRSEATAAGVAPVEGRLRLGRIVEAADDAIVATGVEALVVRDSRVDDAAQLVARDGAERAQVCELDQAVVAGGDERAAPA